MPQISTSHYVNDSMSVPQCLKSIEAKMRMCDTREWKFLNICIKKRKPICLFYSGMSGIVSAMLLHVYYMLRIYHMRCFM